MDSPASLDSSADEPETAPLTDPFDTLTRESPGDASDSEDADAGHLLDEIVKGDEEALATETSQDASPQEAGEDVNSVDLTARLQIQVQIPALPESYLEEYAIVESDIVDFIHEIDMMSESYCVEFTDGRTEKITLDHLLRLRNGQTALDNYLDSASMSRNLRKRKYVPDNDWEAGSESEPDELLSDAMDLDDDESDEPVRQSARRASRRISQKPRVVLTRHSGSNQSDQDARVDSRPSRSLRPRNSNPPSYYGTEISREPKARSDDGSDGDFRPVVSDLATGRGRGRGRGRRLTRGRSRKVIPHRARPTEGGSDIEFEPPRRSSRATKNVQGMNEDMGSDDDDFEGPVKEHVAPKVISIKEEFQAIEPESPFAVAHMQKCHVCAGSRQKGQLIYCQGCSLAYHKACIGYRSAREHMVTKVGEGSFVLQCRLCIGIYTSRDEIAPKYDMCQQCRHPGSSCSAFSKKLTSRQEEKLREENNGVDPVTPVATELINNDANVLFRCQDCHRAWHQHHLPPKDEAGVESDLHSSKSKTWRCSECLDATGKIHRLVAWRPCQQHSDVKGKQVPSWQNVPEDDKEYLVKWESKSYAHCTWRPGAWVFGVSAAVMRKAFGKRDLERSLLKMNEMDAIPDEYLAPDIILLAKMTSTAPVAQTKEELLDNITHVCRIYVKFQGLGHDDVVWDSPPTPDNSALYPAFVEAYREYVQGKYFVQDSPSATRSRIDAFTNEEFQELQVQPEGLKRGKLMGYQLEGLNWLLGNYHHGRSVVLADEMGLGKTVQVVSLVTSLVQDNPKCWPFLIVVPNATCPNWRREFRQWAPDIRVVAYHGGRESQELTYRYELFPERDSGMRAHVVIMSYDSGQDPKTSALFKSVKWAGLVVDEGQRLKNDQNLLYQALRAMKIPFRLLLTGTPLQNNKRELFNLVQFIDPTQDAATLDQQFEVLDKETLPKLHEKIRPYFLRRTKAGVLKFLPPMAQIIVPVTMTVVQEKLAKSIMSKNPELIKAIFADAAVKKTERGNLNNILMQLRKCFCHPFMYSENIEERHHDPIVIHRNLVEASAKLLLLNLMLPKLKERGHRVLIFSQFLHQLDIMEDFLNGIGFQYRRLDGAMSSLEKQRRIDAFNAPDSTIFAFLLSTRAGGVGINLATADTVIIMDPDFNPHQDLQALSRAHRIGQKNKVLCFQLMTKDSVEERIVQVGRSKMALDHALIESMDDDELEGADLESILKHGASALFNDDYQKTRIDYTPAMLESLLDRSQVEQANVEEKKPDGETPFAYARVWDSEKVGFEDMPTAEDEAPMPLNSGVWDKIIAQREEEARQKAEANREILGRGGRRRTKINYNTKGEGQPHEADAGGSSDNDEFAAGNSSSESEDELARSQEEQDATDRDLTGQTNTARRTFQAERFKATANPARHRGLLKDALLKQVTPSEARREAKGSGPEGANGNSGQASQAGKHGQLQNRSAANPPGMMQGARVPDEFWNYVSRLGSEVEIRVAIDNLTRSVDRHAGKQVQLYALHERLRQLCANNIVAHG